MGIGFREGSCGLWAREAMRVAPNAETTRVLPTKYDAASFIGSLLTEDVRGTNSVKTRIQVSTTRP